MAKRLLAFAALAACSVGHKGPVTDHFDGKRFDNVPAAKQPTFGDLLRWQRTKDPGLWPSWIDDPPRPPPPPKVRCDDMRVTFVGHASVLVQTAGINLLTDPHWSERSSPLAHVGPRRRRAPGIRFEDLPPIDVVVVSHNHYDHLDLPTLRRLSDEHSPRIFVGLGNAAWLERKRVRRVHELDWDQTVVINEDVTVTGVPVLHWSLRRLTDRDKTLWLGFVVQTPCGAVYYSGDTGDGPHFAEVGEAYGPFRLALLPIGAYRPRWFMQTSHIDPAQAVAAHRALRAQSSVAVHYGTFALADDGLNEPVVELDRVMPDDVRPDFYVLHEGEALDVPPLDVRR